MRRIAALLVAGLFGVGAGACSAPTPQPSDDNTTEALTQLVDPPTRPPLVTITDATLQPINVDWLLEDGTREVIAPAEDFSVGDLATAPIDPRAVRFEISSPVVPAQLEVTAFDTVDANGVPQGQGHTLDCTKADLCDLTANADNNSLEVGTVTGEDTQVLVLHLYYLVENTRALNPGEAIETNYASYAVRVA